MEKAVPRGAAAGFVDEPIGERTAAMIHPDSGKEIGLRVDLLRRGQRDLPHQIGRGDLRLTAGDGERIAEGAFQRQLKSRCRLEGCSLAAPTLYLRRRFAGHFLGRERRLFRRPLENTHQFFGGEKREEGSDRLGDLLDRTELRF